MSQRIEYATTSDGFVIAMATSGNGPVLISLPAPPDNHVGLEWADPSRRAHLELIGRHRTLIRFDSRGTGLSDREITSFTVEDRVADLEAVVERSGAREFALMTGAFGCQVAFAYAAHNPERVRSLILVTPFLSGREFMPPDQLPMWRGMLRANFRFFTDAVAAETFGWGNERAKAYGEFLRQCVTAETAALIYDAMMAVESAEDASLVSCPTLIIQPSEMGIGSPASGRRVAARIPQSQVTLLEGRPVEGVSPGMLEAIGAFFGEEWAPDDHVDPAPARPEPQLRIILFTDLEGHSAVMQRLGDERGRALLREHEQITREALAASGGSEVKSLGDGFMASFGSAQRALECAGAIQLAVERDGSGLNAAGLRVRVGINAGEPIAEDGDLFGASVIAAARIAALAGGGQVFVADVVRQLAMGKGFLFSDRGALALKGFDEPVRVWEFGWLQR